MALYMLINGEVQPSALKAVIETGSNPEAAARQAVEAAGRLTARHGVLHSWFNWVVLEL